MPVGHAMAWGKPEYNMHEYNLAGKMLVNGIETGLEIDEGLQIINNWRSSHYHPLNTIQLRLRRKAQEVDGSSLVVQRIKRLSSIRHKLERFPHMRLTQIQDIGGCRAILSTVEHLDKLVDIFAVREKGRAGRGVKHKLVGEKDYVRIPQKSGYRGVHLVFQYKSDKIQDYDGLKIEIQFRTYIQHSWATAVETVGTFIGQALKSSMGDEDWRRFFALASSAMASYEGTSLVPSTPTSPDELRAELRKLTEELDVPGHLRAYGSAMGVLDLKEVRGAHYFLLELDADKKSVRVVSYKLGDLERASMDYLAMDKSIVNKNADAVLVSADSIGALKRAYPNYFVDTEAFLKSLNKIIA